MKKIEKERDVRKKKGPEKGETQRSNEEERRKERGWYLTV